MCVGPFLWKDYGTIFTLIVNYFLYRLHNVVCVSELVHILIWHLPPCSTYETILNFCNEWQMTISSNGISSNFLGWTKEQVNIDSFNNVAFFQNEWAIGLSCSHIFCCKKSPSLCIGGSMHMESLLDVHTHEMHFCTLRRKTLEKGLILGGRWFVLLPEKIMPEIAFDHSDFSCNVNKVNYVYPCCQGLKPPLIPYIHGILIPLKHDWEQGLILSAAADIDPFRWW